jgi:hypothetical protein
MTWKSYAAVSGAGLLATYLFSAPPMIAPGRAPATRPAADAGATRLSDDIEEQAARLASHAREQVVYRPPSRNPFRFGARAASTQSNIPAPRAASEPLPEAVQQNPAPAPPPPIRLTGIAANTVNGEQQRVAVLLTSEGVVTAREGDMAGAYRIVRIDEEAVEVVGPDGTTRRLNLRP